MASLLLAQALAAVFASWLLYHQFFRKSQTGGLKLPPGPKPLPIIGNLLDLPPKNVPEFQHWLTHRTYGPVSSVRVFGQTLVLIHSRSAAHEILEKGSAKSAARPHMEFANTLCGFSSFLLLQHHDSDAFRRGRRLVHQQLGTVAAAARSNGVQEEEVGRFLLDVLERPEELKRHLKTEAGAIILKTTYGYSIQRSGRDPLVELINLMMDNFSRATMPLAWLVDVIPALKYLPSWCPGAGFKETARRMNKVNQAVAEIPYSLAKEQVASGRNRQSESSYVSDLIRAQSKLNELSEKDSHAIKWTAASLYAGGADTTVTTMTSFFLAMLLFPGVQRKAQAEIDQLIAATGTDRLRLPGFEDRDKLPYINAIVKEALRWNPVIPLGFVHVASEDIVYEDYLIPKGAALLPAVWWYCHDPAIYSSPDEFMPERYLDPFNEPDPASEVFGYGRRICPGRFFADASLFLTIAQTLAAFEIRKAVDEKTGNEIEVELGVSAGVFNHPKPFEYRIVPRSERHAEIVRRLGDGEKGVVGEEESVVVIPGDIEVLLP